MNWPGGSAPGGTAPGPLCCCRKASVRPGLRIRAGTGPARASRAGTRPVPGGNGPHRPAASDRPETDPAAGPGSRAACRPGLPARKTRAHLARRDHLDRRAREPDRAREAAAILAAAERPGPCGPGPCRTRPLRTRSLLPGSLRTRSLRPGNAVRRMLSGKLRPGAERPVVWLAGEGPAARAAGAGLRCRRAVLRAPGRRRGSLPRADRRRWVHRRTVRRRPAPRRRAAKPHTAHRLRTARPPAAVLRAAILPIDRRRAALRSTAGKLARVLHPRWLGRGRPGGWCGLRAAHDRALRPGPAGGMACPPVRSHRRDRHPVAIARRAPCETRPAAESGQRPRDRPSRDRRSRGRNQDPRQTPNPDTPNPRHPPNRHRLLGRRPRRPRSCYQPRLRHPASLRRPTPDARAAPQRTLPHHRS